MCERTLKGISSGVSDVFLIKHVFFDFLFFKVVFTFCVRIYNSVPFIQFILRRKLYLRSVPLSDFARQAPFRVFPRGTTRCVKTINNMSWRREWSPPSHRRHTSILFTTLFIRCNNNCPHRFRSFFSYHNSLRSERRNIQVRLQTAFSIDCFSLPWEMSSRGWHI